MIIFLTHNNELTNKYLNLNFSFIFKSFYIFKKLQIITNSLTFGFNATETLSHKPFRSGTVTWYTFALFFLGTFSKQKNHKSKALKHKTKN